MSANLQLAVDPFQGQRLGMIVGGGVTHRFLSVFDSIDGDLVTFERKEDAMGAYPESVAIAIGLQFLHIALEIIVHQLHPMADVAADRFFQRPSAAGGPFR